MGPDTSATFADLILRVSEDMRVAIDLRTLGESTNDTRPIAPRDPGHLDRIKRAINDGMKLLTRDNETPGGWYCLRPLATIAVTPNGSGPLVIGGQNFRYRLPWWAQGSPVGLWNWTTTDSLTGHAETRHFDFVQQLIVSDQSVGYPSYVCVIPFESGIAGDRQGWELRIWPRPVTSLILSARFRIVPTSLERDDDRHPFGAIHDETILAAATWLLKRKDPTASDKERDRAERLYKEALAASVKIDLENAPRHLGEDRDVSTHPDFRTRTSIVEGMTLDGVPI